jgi:ParB family chromosome partitioning protein
MAKAKRPNLSGVGMRVVQGALARKPDHPIRHIVADEGLLYLPVGDLRANPDQPRKHFDEESLRDLTASVKEKGVLQPVIARKDAGGEGYILIAGERRWRAATAAGLSTIPALIRSEEDALEVAIIENLQREDLSALDESEALFNLKKVRGFTDAQLAQVVGKSRQAVSESLSLNKLPEPIRDECRALGIGSKIQLLTILRASDDQKMSAAWESVRDGQTTTTRQLKARTQAPEKRPKSFRYRHKPKGKRYEVLVTFSKATVTREEIKAALLDATKSLKGNG